MKKNLITTYVLYFGTLLLTVFLVLFSLKTEVIGENGFCATLRVFAILFGVIHLFFFGDLVYHFIKDRKD